MSSRGALSRWRRGVWGCRRILGRAAHLDDGEPASRAWEPRLSFGPRDSQNFYFTIADVSPTSWESPRCHKKATTEPALQELCSDLWPRVWVIANPRFTSDPLAASHPAPSVAVTVTSPHPCSLDRDTSRLTRAVNSCFLVSRMSHRSIRGRGGWFCKKQQIELVRTARSPIWHQWYSCIAPTSGEGVATARIRPPTRQSSMVVWFYKIDRQTEACRWCAVAAVCGNLDRSGCQILAQIDATRCPDTPQHR